MVGVLIENDLLRGGLTAALDQISRVDTLQLDRSSARDVLAGQPGPQVVIVTPTELGLLEPQTPADDGPRERQTQVLLLVDESRLDDPETLGLSTVDGVALQNELSVEVLDDTLRRLTIGEAPMPARLMRHLMNRTAGGISGLRQRPASLTSREQETLALLADGLSNKQIARALGVSTHGAKRLVGSLLVKLGAQNRTAAVIIAMRLGLIATP